MIMNEMVKVVRGIAKAQRRNTLSTVGSGVESFLGRNVWRPNL